MSTRRARIKAITSLPVRRKTAEVSDNSKNKSAKENLNQLPQSPRTLCPALISSGQEDDKDKPVIRDVRKSPVIKTTSPVHNEESSVISSAFPKELESHHYDVKVTIVESPQRATPPPRAEKVSVITPNINYKRNSTSSPTTHDFASPVAPSPRISKSVGVIVQGPNTPRKLKTPSAHTIDENNELQITGKNVNSVVYNSVSSKSAVSDDYNVPSVPESVENDGVMDGIVPLQTETNVPKPIDILKSEIISENAEVLFDPIIPLPSPSKVRPKLRPTPRLGPHRRNSVQGSASESEDESRRVLLGGANTPRLGRQRHDSQSALSSAPNKITDRKRNNSVCSSVSQSTSQANTLSPTKDKNSSKIRRREVYRRMAAIRRKKEALQRDTLTMYDLIFYNPPSNPIIPDSDEIKAKEESKKDEENLSKSTKEEKKEKESTVTSPTAAPVPQIKLGPNGEIILDKSSLVINQTESDRKVTSVVREGSWGGGGGKYHKAKRTLEWSACETVRFYRALAALGTDFSLMASLFPDRSRRDLKLKFKKEERINSAQVDKALRAGNSWDPNLLRKEFQDERAEAIKKAKRDAEKLKLAKLAEKERLKTLRERRVRNSRASKALQSTMLPGVLKKDDIATADDLVEHALQVSKRKKYGTRNMEQEKPVESHGMPITPDVPSSSNMATLTLLNNGKKVHGQTKSNDNMATLTRISPASSSSPLNLNSMPNVPSNIETGSLVVLTVNDPSSPSKKMLQTYIAHSAGRLTPVALPPTFLNSVVGYMKKGTPKSTVSSSSSPLMSPSSASSLDSRTGVATPLTNVNASPKRKRMSSYTITQL